MSSKSFYSLTTKSVFHKYDLPKVMKLVFQKYDDYKMGSIDGVELGRLIRSSISCRAAVATTINLCTAAIKKDAQQLKTCIDIIEICTEVLQITESHPPPTGFSLMKLPCEIRMWIFRYIIDLVFETNSITPAKKRTRCRCVRPTTIQPFLNSKTRAIPALIISPAGTEFAQELYRSKGFHFKCTCDLYFHLSKQPHFMHNVKHIKLHWCGPDSDKAFTLLKSCTRLETLNLKISPASLENLSVRSSVMQPYFPHIFQRPRIIDALGMDELLQIRGLQHVEVMALKSRTSNRSLESDVLSLSLILADYLHDANFVFEDDD